MIVGGKMNNIITNRKYDELAEKLDEFLLDELEITIDGGQTTELMMIILNTLNIKKE